jgi:hypothetical protein
MKLPPVEAVITEIVPVPKPQDEPQDKPYKRDQNDRGDDVDHAD